MALGAARDASRAAALDAEAALKAATQRASTAESDLKTLTDRHRRITSDLAEKDAELMDVMNQDGDAKGGGGGGCTVS